MLQRLLKILDNFLCRVEKKEDWRKQQEIADAANPQMMEAFLLAVAKLQEGVNLKQVEAALARNDIDAAIAQIDWTAFDAELGRVGTIARSVMSQAGEVAAESLMKQTGITMRFDLTNPHAVEWSRQHTAELIVEIGEESRAAIRAIIVDAVEHGGHPYQTARQIRKYIGLTERHAIAVQNYWRKVASDGMRTASQAEKMADTYAKKLLRRRAETIARTETMFASNAGQQSLWMDAMDKGLLDKNEIWKQWIVTPDDRTCLPAKTPIMTINGWKSISKIKIGDYVLTHKDRFQKVVATNARHYNGPVVRLDCGGRARIRITATYGHPILTKTGWKSIEEVKETDQLVILAKPCVDCGFLIPSGPGNREVCYSCSNKRSNKIRWSDLNEHIRLIEYNNKRWTDPEERIKASIRMSGGNSPSKNPEVCNKIRNSMLHKYMDPVYYARQAENNRRTAKLPNHPFRRQTFEERTANFTKALKARGQNHFGNTYLEKKMRWFLEEQEIEFKQQWYFTYDNNDKRGWVDFYLPGPNVVIECDGWFHEHDEKTKQRDIEKNVYFASKGITVLRFTDYQIRQKFHEVASIIRQNCCFMAVNSKSVTHSFIRHQPVYNLQVEEDESYVAGGIVVHNCAICVNIGKDKAPIDEVFPVAGVMFPPKHPNCRCAMGLVEPAPK